MTNFQNERFCLLVIILRLTRSTLYISYIIISHSWHPSCRGCRWWPLSRCWGEADMKYNTLRHKNGWKTGWRDCGDWRKTRPLILIVMWQLLYVGNALVLIAVPLGERGALCWWVAMMKPGRAWGRERHRGKETCKWESKWVKEEGIRDGENGKQRWSHLPGHLLQSSLPNQSSLSS